MTKKESTLENLKQMEAIYQKANETLKVLDENIADLKNMNDDIRKLSAYYGSKQWVKDFEADEKGLLPKDMSRGVLSEDGVYDLLDKYKEVMEMTGPREEDKS